MEAQATNNQPYTEEQLQEARRIIHQATTNRCKELRERANQEEAEPAELTIVTSKGYETALYADSAELAKLLLKHEDHAAFILGDEQPDDLWEALEEQYGVQVSEYDFTD